MSPSPCITLPAPAKLNLFLHITGRRKDGYHELQTLFQLLEWGDTLQLRATAGPEITLSSALPGVATADNIAVKAARALQRHTGTKAGASIAIDKQIPMGGGLGGGSSNAATTLLGLNYLWSLGLSVEELARIGLALGADVPVFVHGHSSLAEGIGETLVPIELPKRWYLVLYPGVHVETATIFGAPQLTRDTLPIRIPAFFETGSRRLNPALLSALLEGPASPRQVSLPVLKNDCENVAKTLYPEIGEALAWLRQQAEIGSASMTGTGACVFGVADSRDSAEQVLARLPARWQGFVSQSSNRSTAHRALEKI